MKGSKAPQPAKVAFVDKWALKVNPMVAYMPILHPNAFPFVPNAGNLKGGTPQKATLHVKGLEVVKFETVKDDRAP